MHTCSWLKIVVVYLMSVCTMHSKKYAHDLCCMFCCNDLTHILQGYITGTEAIIWLPQCQCSNPEGYGQIISMDPQNKSHQNNTKHNKNVFISYRMYFMSYYIWELWCQKQVSQGWISNCIPQYSVGCSYFSMPGIPVSGTEVLICWY